MLQQGGGGGVPSPLSAFSLGRCGLWVLEHLIREKLTMTHYHISSSLTALPLTHVFPRNGSGPLLERSREDKYSPKSDRPNMEAEPFSQLFLDEKKSA